MVRGARAARWSGPVRVCRQPARRPAQAARITSGQEKETDEAVVMAAAAETEAKKEEREAAWAVYRGVRAKGRAREIAAARVQTVKTRGRADVTFA